MCLTLIEQLSIVNVKQWAQPIESNKSYRNERDSDGLQSAFFVGFRWFTSCFLYAFFVSLAQQSLMLNSSRTIPTYRIYEAQSHVWWLCEMNRFGWIKD